MNNNHHKSFGYSINGRSVSIKVESNEKIENYDKYAIMKEMLTEEMNPKSKIAEKITFRKSIPSSKEKLYESQFQDWLGTLKLRFTMGLKPGVLREGLTELLEKTSNIYMPKDKYELITETIVDKEDLLYNYFEKLVYPLLQT